MSLSQMFVTKGLISGVFRLLGGIAMKQNQMSAIEIDRKKKRILESLEAAFHHSTFEDGRLLIAEAANELEDYEKKVYQVETPTVVSVVQGMYELSMACFDKDVDREIVQDMLFSDVELLAELLGIELK